MDSHQIDNALDRHMTRLRALAIAFCASAGAYVVVAVVLERIVQLGALIEMPFSVAATVATLQLVVILAGYLASRLIRNSPGSGGGTEEALQRYTASVIVASALREVAAVVGFVLTLLTGDLLWVLVLCAAAVTSMLVHWPRREAVRDFLQQRRSRR